MPQFLSQTKHKNIKNDSDIDRRKPNMSEQSSEFLHIFMLMARKIAKSIPTMQAFNDDYDNVSNDIVTFFSRINGKFINLERQKCLFFLRLGDFTRVEKRQNDDRKYFNN